MIRRALHMGDELHSRNTAAPALFMRELTPHFLEARRPREADGVRADRSSSCTRATTSSCGSSMAAAKAMADAAHGVEGSCVVTAMTISCRGFAIRVSGLGDDGSPGPHAVVEAQLFEGFTEDDIEWIGGESHITETVGLGGFAQAAAFALQAYQGGSAAGDGRDQPQMYEITVGEQHRLPDPVLRLPRHAGRHRRLQGARDRHRRR